MQKRGRGRGQDAHGAQDDEGAVEAHDKAVVALGAFLQAVGDGLQDHQLAQAVGGNRDVGDFPGNGRAVADGNADVSGGQGSDENISEAEAMTAWLTDKGIDKSRIIAEDKATSTLENLENSFNIIRQRGDDPNDSCAVVTSEYHIYRAKLLAQSLDVSVGSVAAHTTYLPIMVNYFIREAFGVTYQLVFC